MEELEQLPIPLLAWYGENARVLPWRVPPGREELGEPYRVWVSEVMLQQTRVAAVIGYYTRFMEALPTVADLAEVEETRLLKLWEGLGYYSRARNLHRGAKQIMDEFGGVFPGTWKELRSLCGVGDYTAGAVGSLAFGLAVPAVDGNVLRVITRITGDESDIAKPATKSKIETALRQVMPIHAPGDFNQALMELGATVCLPNGEPKCAICPAEPFCRAHREGTTRQIPVKAPKKPRKSEDLTVCLLFHQGKVALRRRPSKGLLAGLWEFPNAPLAPDEALESWALPSDWTMAGIGRHIFTHREWHMTAVVAQRDTDQLPKGWVWVDRQTLSEEYPLPSAFSFCLPVVEANLAKANTQEEN